MLKSVKLGTILILVMLSLSLYFYPSMPEKMATHWGLNGKPDAHSSKITGLTIIPLISMFILFLFAVIPKIDPLARNIIRFLRYYEALVVVIIGFMLYVHILLIAWNMGLRFNMSFMTMPAAGLLFVYLGLILRHAKRNWFVGIRTPWTLSDERVWDKTHELGGKLFMICGIIVILSPILGKIAPYIVIGTLASITVFLFIYSYWLWSKLRKS